jgi:predicted ATP-binding protein involved in virulence
MHIEYLSIKNFRAFKNVELRDIPRLCVVVGANGAGKPETVVRIACRELESWYLGDLAAVERALKVKNLALHAQKAKYRIPDKIGNPSSELRSLTKGAYQKINGSRSIGKEMNPDNNTSYSFKEFIKGVRRLL